jgi:hypothetical protein
MNLFSQETGRKCGKIWMHISNTFDNVVFPEALCSAPTKAHGAVVISMVMTRP